MESLSHTILVVDDEAHIRDFARHVLENQGYQVLTAKNGVEAVLLGEHHPGAISALITDLNMPPYMGGCELAQSMRRMRPGIGVIYISGYPADAVVQGEVLEEKADFLAKPFTPEMLINRLKEMLRRPAPAPVEQPRKTDRAILLLVPDGTLRTGIAALLRVEGMQVLESRNFAEALIICQWHVGLIGLFLADKDMLARLPSELLERLGQVRPEMRILAASAAPGEGEPIHERVRRLLEEWGLEVTGEE
ncbi:MAG: Blue-light-activated protein [Fibrobacteres bacterium]|nr:Blue-light-activated protein [Fibrobacterota bacterium]